MINGRVLVVNERKIVAQMQALDRRTQRTVVRQATNAAGKATFSIVKRNARAIKQTGFTERSLRRTSRSRKGTTTNKIGQLKKKTFKPRKTTRSRGRNLSQFQRAGKPTPIHWIEEGTVPHIVRARPGKFLVFPVRRGRGNRLGLVFTKRVRNPGMRAKHLLRRSARQAQRPAALAFAAVVRQTM